MATSLFGKRKFGTFKFGPTVLKNPRYGLEVDWDGDALFDGSNEGPNLQDLSIECGRKYTVSAEGDSLEAEDTGRLSAVLIDQDRRYDPYNVSSPLFGMLTGGKYFRCRVRSMTDQIYPLIAGKLDEPISYMERRMPMARFQGTDGWGYLRDQGNLVTVPLQENIYAEQAIQKVLDAADWPRLWGTDMNEGVDARPYFWVDSRSPAQVIHELAHNELGNVCITGEGKLKFRSRLSLETESMLITDDDVINVQKMTPAEVVRNVINVQSAPRSEQATAVVWGIPGRLQVQAGQTIDDVFAEFTYNNETVPVKSPITPVPTTDFNAKANEDGTGTDYTANFTVSMYAYSTKAQLSITNNGGTTAWIYVRVRGNPITKANSVSFAYRGDASIKQFGPRPFTLSIDQSVNIARQYRDLLGTYLTQAKNYLVLDLMPEPDVQFAGQLGMIIRARLTNHGIDQAYRLIRYSHKFHDKNGIVVKTRWWLEPYVRLFTGVQIPFQLPVQLGGFA
jgi:hypothetical protein